MTEHDEALGVLDALNGDTHYRWAIQKSGKVWRIALFSYRGAARYDTMLVHDTATLTTDNKRFTRREARKAVRRRNRFAVTFDRRLRPKFHITG